MTSDAFLRRVVGDLAESTRGYIREQLEPLQRQIRELTERVQTLESTKYCWRLEERCPLCDGLERHLSQRILGCARRQLRLAPGLEQRLATRGAWRRRKGIYVMSDDDVRVLDDDAGGDWKLVLDVRSTPAEVEQVIADQTRAAIDDFRLQLEADRDITPRQREALLARAKVFVERTTREAVESGYTRLLPVH
jgi:hypothetical protein